MCEQPGPEHEGTREVEIDAALDSKGLVIRLVPPGNSRRHGKGVAVSSDEQAHALVEALRQNLPSITYEFLLSHVLMTAANKLRASYRIALALGGTDA